MKQQRRLKYVLEYPIIWNGKRNWGMQQNVWLMIKPRSVNWRFRSGVEETIISHSVRLRWIQTLKVGYRFRRGTQSFIIHAMEDMGDRKRWLECHCEERLIHPQAN